VESRVTSCLRSDWVGCIILIIGLPDLVEEFARYSCVHATAAAQLLRSFQTILGEFRSILSS
jgi:hypothetical protein